MKLLSTIAFLLLTFSAFSQERLSYEDGIIKQGEEVLSLEELSVLVNGADITYTEGIVIRHFKFDAEKTKRQALAGDDKKAARALNAEATIGAVASIGAAIVLVPIGVVLWIFGGLGGEVGASAFGGAVAVLGIVLVGMGGSSASKLGTSEQLEQRAELSIYEAVNLYNASLLEAQ
ncbi:hypothetical protein N9P28_00920 [Schleiferiaceae bacterium]|nr:hypothetical protein [Schleiferiaceae bacterium]